MTHRHFMKTARGTFSYALLQDLSRIVGSCPHRSEWQVEVPVGTVIGGFSSSEGMLMPVSFPEATTACRGCGTVVLCAFP